MGKIIAGSWTYVLTEDDKLWAARMCQYEGNGPSYHPGDVLWTMTQAYSQPNIHSQYPTFAAFIQNYSQPINPKWRRDGQFCRSGGEYAGTERCSETALHRRDLAASLPWSGIRADVKAAVSSWFAGTLPNTVPKAVEFADARVSQSFLDRPANAGSVVVKRAGNWYIATRSSLRWSDNFVRMLGSTALPILLMVLGLSAGVGFALYQRRRRMRGFGGIQEDAEEADHEASEAYHESLWVVMGRGWGGAWDPEDGPRDRRKGRATEGEDRSGNPHTTIVDSFDCGDLNKTIKKLDRAKVRLRDFVFGHDPEVFDNILLPQDYPEQPTEDRVIDPDYVERWEEMLDNRIEATRRVARANGCAQIAGLKRLR